MKAPIDEKELLRRMAQLPREISPDNDVWTGISARIDEPSAQIAAGASRRHWPLRAVAAALLAVSLGLVLTAVWQVPPERAAGLADRSAAGPAPQAPPGPEQTEVFAGLLAGSDAEYQAAFREYLAVSPEPHQLSDVTLVQIETGWAELLRMETELVSALSADPDDPFLNGRMLELRARQLSYLKQLAALDRNNRRLST